MNKWQIICPLAALALAGLGFVAVIRSHHRHFIEAQTRMQQAFLDKISHGPEAELGSLIYGFSDASSEVQEILLEMVRPLRAPSPEKHMTVEASRDAGRFTMLSVRVPWPQPKQGYGFQASFQPMIICHEADRDLVIGYVLPFNDIMSQFDGTDMQDILQLSQWWVQTYGNR